METTKTHSLSPREWLDDLLSLFPGEGLGAARFQVIRAREVPQPYAELLVHDRHMTVALERRHRSEVCLEVLAVRRWASEYARRLVLRAGAGGPVVLAGVMRVRLDVCDAVCGGQVCREITLERRPLGRILIEHQVLRRIEAVHFLRVGLEGQAAAAFGTRPPEDTYGRLALIFCGGIPSVELLEVVAPEAGGRGAMERLP